VAPEALPSLRPRCPGSGWDRRQALVLQLQPAVLCSSTHRMLARLFLLMLLPMQTRQGFGLTNPPVSQMIFFSMDVKIFQAERVVLFVFFLNVHTGGIIISPNITHILASSG